MVVGPGERSSTVFQPFCELSDAVCWSRITVVNRRAFEIELTER